MSIVKFSTRNRKVGAATAKTHCFRLAEDNGSFHVLD